MTGQRQPRNESHYHKTRDCEHVAEQFSWIPLPYCSSPRCFFPIKSLALLARVSPWTIPFSVLDKSPLLGSPFLQQMVTLVGFFFTVTDILTTWGTQGPVCPPMEQTQWPQPGPFSPWSPPNTDNWPECPDCIRKKRRYLPLSPSLSLFPSYPFLSYHFFLVLQSWAQASSRRTSAWAESWRNITSAWPRIWILVQFLSGFWFGLSSVLVWSGSGRAKFQSSLPWRPRVKSRNAWVSADGQRSL